MKPSRRSFYSSKIRNWRQNGNCQMRNGGRMRFSPRKHGEHGEEKRKIELPVFPLPLVTPLWVFHHRDTLRLRSGQAPDIEFDFSLSLLRALRASVLNSIRYT